MRKAVRCRAVQKGEDLSGGGMPEDESDLFMEKVETATCWVSREESTVIRSRQDRSQSRAMAIAVRASRKVTVHGSCALWSHSHSVSMAAVGLRQVW